jgi:tetratricopeptide (TPR) repeat protein
VTSRAIAAFAFALSAGSLGGWQEAPEIHLGRGYEALKQNRFEEAANEFRGALKLDPRLVLRARFPLGVALFDMKDTVAARQEFEAVRRELGDHPNVLYYLGRLDLADQNFDGAIRNLMKAMDNPPFPDTAYHLGFACMKKGDMAAAEKWLKVAAEANPEDSAVPYQLGLVYRKEGREADAKRALERSSELRQRNAQKSQLESDCARKLDQGPRDEARAVCSRLYDANDIEKLTALGTLYGQHGDLEAALGPLQRAAELAPQSPQMQYNLAFTYYEMGRFEEARAPIAKAAERWPDLFQLNALYGAVLVTLGREGDASPVLERAHRLNPQDARTTEMLFRTLLTLGRRSFEARNYREALQYYDKALMLRPKDAEAQRGRDLAAAR